MEYPNWFNMTAKENFENFLTDHKIIDVKNALQLGAFTGDASLWLMENTSCHLTDVDTWEGSGDEEGVIGEFDFTDVGRTYEKKLEQYRPPINRDMRLNTFVGTTQQFLTKVQDPSFYPRPYDFIYIDADHTAKAVLEDAVNSYPLLKVGGIMAFDDYTWRCNEGMLKEPWMAIDMFAAIYRDRFKLLAKNSQYWMRKVA